MDWAEVVKSYRQKNGLLQKQLAYDFGVDVMTVSRWERGITEPSKLQKGKLKDLVTARKSPAAHPYFRQAVAFSGAMTVTNLATESYLMCSDDTDLFRVHPDELIGAHPAKFFYTDLTHDAYDLLGGFKGMLDRGMMSASYTVAYPLAGQQVTAEFLASVLKLDGYDPVFISKRRLTNGPVTRSAHDIPVVYEDDLPHV